MIRPMTKLECLYNPAFDKFYKYVEIFNKNRVV